MSTDLHTLSGAYAIDALSPEEAQQFREHFDECPACQQEVRELRDAAARMGASEATPPPPGLRARVLAAADQQAQLPPRVRTADVRPSRPRHASPGTSGSSTPGSSPTSSPGQSPGRSPGQPRWVPRLLAAAAAVVLIAVGGVVVNQQATQEPESTLAAPVMQVFEAQDANTATMRTTNGGEVSVATSPTLGKMAVDTDELPEPGEGNVYQLWSTADGQTMESRGLLEEPKAGAAMDMPEPGVEVAITVEPEGGSEQPTSDPIMRVTPSEV